LKSRKRKKSGKELADSAKVLTILDLAEYLQVHRSTIYRLLKKGQTPAFKIGGDWRFNIEEIDHWRLHQGAEQLADPVRR
jgi:excisionase family DNA binding protein